MYARITTICECVLSWNCIEEKKTSYVDRKYVFVTLQCTYKLIINKNRYKIIIKQDISSSCFTLMAKH